MDLTGFLKRDFMVWIDTSSILEDSFFDLFSELTSLFTQYDEHLYIPNSVLLELKKHTKSDDYELQEKSKERLALINSRKKSNIFTVYNKGEKKTFADNELITIFTELRLEKNLLLITQDKDLARDILDLGKSKSVISKKVEVLTIDHNTGNLRKITFRKNKHNECTVNEQNGVTTTINIYYDEPDDEPMPELDEKRPRYPYATGAPRTLLDDLRDWFGF